MKKLLMVMGCLSAAWIVSAAQNDVLITFSTPGTDTYTDGTAVLDGERSPSPVLRQHQAFGIGGAIIPIAQCSESSTHIDPT